MLDLIKKALGIEGGGCPASEKTRTELIASVLLLEAVHADYEAADEEIEHVVETIKSIFGLEESYVRELMELAHAERKKAVDLHCFTRMANERMGREEKLRILDAVWRIIFADGRIDKYEEHYARRLAKLLWLEHSDFIAAKLKAKGAGP